VVSLYDKIDLRPMKMILIDLGLADLKINLHESIYNKKLS